MNNTAETESAPREGMDTSGSTRDTAEQDMGPAQPGTKQGSWGPSKPSS
jgi:hypothetical protein